MSQSQSDNPFEPIVLTVQQAAKLLQISENHLYSLIARNAVPHTRFGKLIRIPRWALLQFIATSSGAPLSKDSGVAFVPESEHSCSTTGDGGGMIDGAW